MPLDREPSRCHHCDKRIAVDSKRYLGGLYYCLECAPSVLRPSDTMLKRVQARNIRMTADTLKTNANSCLAAIKAIMPQYETRKVPNERAALADRMDELSKSYEGFVNESRMYKAQADEIEAELSAHQRSVATVPMVNIRAAE